MTRVLLRPWFLGLVALALTLTLSLALATSQAGAAARARAAAAQAADQPGAPLFAQRCSVCHGTNASGKMGPALNVLPPDVASLPPDQLRKELVGLVRGGIPGAMPMFTPELLSDEQIGQIADYLVSLNGKVPGPSLYEALASMKAEDAKGRTFFAETGHSVGGEFLAFWRGYGGLRVFGLPLSEEYNGVSPENGQTYTMQLFERARLELHPDLPAGQQVQLALLGAEELRLRTHFLQQRAEMGGMRQR